MRTVFMEPVQNAGPWEDKLTRIVTTSDHGGADDSSHIKCFQHVTIIAINFQDCGFEVGRGIRLNEYPLLPGSIL